MIDAPIPPEAFSALESCRRQREAIGRAGRITLLVDHSPRQKSPRWRVVADGLIWAAYDPDLIGTVAV